jgi:hypothetical protein
MKIDLGNYLVKGETIRSAQSNAEIIVVIRVDKSDWHEYLRDEVDGYATLCDEFLIDPPSK